MRLSEIDEKALAYHETKPRGKLCIQASKPVASLEDLELAYSPGVAAPVRRIIQDKSQSYRYTSRGNLVGVITNGTAVLGLGNIGPHASKPVMEGKAILFKTMADIDCFDIELDTEDIDQMFEIITAMEPTFGGVNLENIRAPDCFELEQRLQEAMNIPVFHDDQHGTAIVVAAALINAGELTHRKLSDMKVVINGAGAAGIASATLLLELGVSAENLTLCDINGVVNINRRGQLHQWLLPFAKTTEYTTLDECLVGADAVIGLSVKDTINQEMIVSMAPEPIIFAMANPDSEITPEEVWQVAPNAIVCTGRRDDPNQVNNLLAFPYIFRGALDIAATRITLNMKKAAVYALVEIAKVMPDFSRQRLLPTPFDENLKTILPNAVSNAAIKDKVNLKTLEAGSITFSPITDKTPTANANVPRLELDLIGDIEIPKDRYYGSQTARAIENFPITGVAISDMPEFITALAWVKKAAAITNYNAGTLSASKKQIICVVCEEILTGKLHHEFLVDVIQGGAGTSSNMNMNEVIANRGLELLGFDRGDYHHLHPNDDVNQSQSTNDTYATAVRLTMVQICDHLIASVTSSTRSFRIKAGEFSHVQKLGRTQLQDAVPMTLGAEFQAFANTLAEDISRIREVRNLFLEVNMGGTAIGTGIGTNQTYREQIVEKLSKISNLDLKSAQDKVEASWDTGAFVLFSGVLKRLATKYSKISNDLRLLSSGPRGGFAEINIPKVQAGSSIMPGKVNPVIPEVMNQVCFKIFGMDTTVTFASEAGQLQLNAMEPIILWSIFDGCKSLVSAIETLKRNCVDGITANIENCEKNLENSTAYVTALVPIIGYKQSSQVAIKMLQHNFSLQEALNQIIPERAESVFNEVADKQA